MIARLDYSKPPPGYETPFVGAWGQWAVLVPLATVSPAHGLATESEAIAAAWTHYKIHNDPPGMQVVGEGGTARAKRPRPVRWRIYVLGAASGYYRETRALARSEAWDKHDRRLALAATDPSPRARGALTDWHINTSAMTPVWPRCLAWPNEQVDEVERWLVDSTAEMPEVLRG